jgi:hypothetical protein
MTTYARSPIQQQASPEPTGPRLSDEDRDKLQEIHELINRMLGELQVMAQPSTQPAQQYLTPALGLTPLSPVPYTYSVLPVPWGGIPLWTRT